MRVGAKIPLCFVVIICLFTQMQAKEWRGIVPLHSTRADVERLLGIPKHKLKNTYKLKEGNVIFSYSSGACIDHGYNVPLDTVVSIAIYPKTKLTAADLQIDASKSQKVADPELGGVFYFYNEEEGIIYQVSKNGRVFYIEYTATSKDDALLCPEAQREIREIKRDRKPQPQNRGCQ